MAQKIRRLTFEELQRHIQQVVNQAGGNADDDKNSPVKIANPDIEAKDPNKGLQSLLDNYGNGTYLFYADDRLGRSLFVTFHPTSITKLSDGIATLRGDVVFERKQSQGNVYIDFHKNQLYYRSRCRYDLEPDNRTKPAWDVLVSQLKSLLDNTILP